MAATDRPTTALAADVERARFVRVLSRADGDSLAASALLARARAAAGTPFHVSVVPTVGERTARARESGEPGEQTVVVGHHDADALALESADRSATLLACEVVRALDGRPDPVLALAGIVAAGVEPGAGETEWLLEAAREHGSFARRDGIAIPTADVVDGLAHATTCHGPWSGDVDATREALAGVALGTDGDEREPDHRRIASLVALDVVGDPTLSDASATAIARTLRPFETREAPFETLGGYADVLEATATTAPGVGVALALGHDVRERALAVWRDHGERAHDGLSNAETSRHDGLSVYRIDDGPVATVARLAADFCSPEPTVLAVRSEAGVDEPASEEPTAAAAVATRDSHSLEAMLEALVAELEDEVEAENAGVDYDVGPRYGTVAVDPDSVPVETLVDATREVCRP